MCKNHNLDPKVLVPVAELGPGSEFILLNLNIAMSLCISIDEDPPKA